MLSTALNKRILVQLLNGHKQQIMLFGVQRLSLFGSFVRDTASDDSDVDLFVEFEEGKKTYDNFMDLSFYLEDLLGRKVELLTHRSLNKYIGPHILSELEHVL